MLAQNVQNAQKKRPMANYPPTKAPNPTDNSELPAFPQVEKKRKKMKLGVDLLFHHPIMGRA